MADWKLEMDDGGKEQLRAASKLIPVSRKR